MSGICDPGVYAFKLSARDYDGRVGTFESVRFRVVEGSEQTYAVQKALLDDAFAPLTANGLEMQVRERCKSLRDPTSDDGYAIRDEVSSLLEVPPSHVRVSSCSLQGDGASDPNTARLDLLIKVVSEAVQGRGRRLHQSSSIGSLQPAGPTVASPRTSGVFAERRAASRAD